MRFIILTAMLLLYVSAFAQKPKQLNLLNVKTFSNKLIPSKITGKTTKIEPLKKATFSKKTIVKTNAKEENKTIKAVASVKKANPENSKNKEASVTKKAIAKETKVIVSKKKGSIVEKKEPAKLITAKSNKKITEKVVVKKQSAKPARFEVDTFKMLFPLEDPAIKHHYGKIKIRGSYYNNQTVTFSTDIHTEVFCTVDSGVVQNIDFDENVYTVFIKKADYLIVLSNIAVLDDIKKGQVLNVDDLIGLVAISEMNENEGELELMLFKNDKIVNPEKYLIKDIGTKKNISFTLAK
jgi:hypothetical protein